MLRLNDWISYWVSKQKGENMDCTMKNEAPSEEEKMHSGMKNEVEAGRMMESMMDRKEDEDSSEQSKEMMEKKEDEDPAEKITDIMESMMNNDEQTGEKVGSTVKKEEAISPGLIDFIFSWPIPDVMNNDLYPNKVNQIPETFSSVPHYLTSFVTPLIEETRADLRSNLVTLHSAPACDILSIEQSPSFKPPKTLLYRLEMKKLAKSDASSGIYDPGVGDLIALTEVRPKCIDDLNGPKLSYVLALVQGMDIKERIKIISILSSKPIFDDYEYEKKKKKEAKEAKLFAVYLTNTTTNMRIWSALHPGEGGNTEIISSVLGINPLIDENCTICSAKTERKNLEKSRELVGSQKLDVSQQEAVMNCIGLTECDHENSVKLIWGPPGTGKTKTISSLVFALLKMKCKTVTCAPTNVAILGVTNRLMSIVVERREYDSYGLGDVVLFGNGERMKIDEHEDLHDVFLNYRVEILGHCFAPLSGWRGSLDEMLRLLEDPEYRYSLYLIGYKVKDAKNDDDDDGDEERLNKKDDLSVNKVSKRESIKKFLEQNKKENKKKSKEDTKNKDSKAKNEVIIRIPWTFEEFFTKNFFRILERLSFCTTGLYTHMPTSFLPLNVVKDMLRALDFLLMIKTSLQKNISKKDWLKDALISKKEAGKTHRKTSLQSYRLKCLVVLRLLRQNLSLPDLTEEYQIKNFCLQNACLIFCTVSSSAKLHTKGMAIELVIIDEAGQVKECESTIPLQLPGVKHAVLVGDEKQLPPMVISKICEKSGFGRSLFERLVILGHSKHLLNVQYRMHPSISLFPNKEFYGNRIRDGPNVTSRAYERRFVAGKLFGSYSFINVTNGKEEFDNRHSRKNVMEVSVIAKILSKLHKESNKSRQKVRVGCISPYKAQVLAIQDALGKTYSKDANDAFSVNVRSVDGFQGGEEDVIIISTVRSNGNGSVGFLDNRQRANVALTRAKYCLWIVGNGATLLNSGSVWQKLVIDSKNRGCFYNAYEDSDLCSAISSSMVDLGQLKSLFATDSVLFKSAKWKIFFSPLFHESMIRFGATGIQKEVTALLVKLSSGYQLPERHVTGVEGASSQLLKSHFVKPPLKLIWTVEIRRENKTDFQVIRVLGVLSGSEIPEFAKEFDRVVGNYTVNQMNRCLYKQIEGGLMIPMTWPVEADARSNCSSSDVAGRLAGQLGAMSLTNKSTSPITRKYYGRSRGGVRYKNNHVRVD